MKRSFHLLVLLITLLTIALPIKLGQASFEAQDDAITIQAQRLFNAMSAEERVGQVFLVSFQGTDVATGSQINNLIVNKHVGGVVLRVSNDNLTGPENTLPSLQELTRNLQSVNYQTHADANTLRTYSPLLIGIQQAGDLYDGDQILSGVTSLPNLMTIGATWKPEYAQAVGKILGDELSSLGINLLLGPSLDVLDTVRMDGKDNLGVKTFGGDPYWVGLMGNAYIKGVHEGSSNRMAVVATHFPGRGSADREPDEEIATVRKSLEQLKQIELYPFFAVTGNNEDQAEITDGLLLSHIRYQGFQGNIRATTKPVSFDAAALEQIMLLPEFNDWRLNGGVIVSDDLGTDAVRKFVDPLNTGYDARQVARSALLAGNDLLYLGNIIATGDPDSHTTVVRTIDYFVQKYEEDSAFQVRVDQAVLNILRLKVKLYPELTLEAVLPGADSLEEVGTHQSQIEEIIKASATLINPSAEEIPAVLPDPPQYTERIVIISDVVPYKQCSVCTEQSIFPAQSLMNSLVRLYGAGAGDPIQAANIKVYSFESIRLILENAAESETTKTDINAAQWIIFALSEFSATQPEAVIFQRFFNERPELVRNKKIIGMAFNAPYFMDATDISKFSAYYAFYSKIPEAFDVAARTLLQEFSPVGILPVSVPGIEYDLVKATSPDPNQMIPLYIESPDGTEEIDAVPPSDYSQPLLYKAGDTIPVRAGPILDNNGHPVPDGTMARFLIDTRSISGTVEQMEAQTIDGYARITYKIASVGSLELKVTSEPALISQILRLDITNAGGVVTSYEPTVPVQVTDESTPTPPPTPTPERPLVQTHKQGRLAVSDWFLANLLIFSTAILFSLFSSRALTAKWKFFTLLCLALGGNLGYLYFALGGTKAQAAISENGTLYVLLIVLIGMLIGLGCGLVFYWIRRKK